jgi:FdhD protein
MAITQGDDSSGSRHFTGVAITRVLPDARKDCVDQVAVEEPLEIQLSAATGDGTRAWKTVAITMRTPGHDRELALGFLSGEGLIRSPRDIETVYSCGARFGRDGWQNRVRVALSSGAPFDFTRLQRNFYMSSSCGVCGKTALEALLMNEIAPLADTGWKIEPRLVQALPERLRESQKAFERTGGLHGAGLFTHEGKSLCVHEDVGRHNAVDKVIGADILAEREGHAEHILVVSGRASFELVQKAAAARIPMLAAVGAPSSLAVQLAANFGLTLVGFVKASGFNIYSGAQRIAGEETLRQHEAAAVLSAR